MIETLQIPVIPPATALRRGRWVEVISHIDPRYGGLSATVPALSLALSKLGFDVGVAAFCAPHENTTPEGFSTGDPDHLSFWPAERTAWLTQSTELRGRFRDLLRDAQGIHIHGLWEQSTAIAASSARSLKVPYIVSAHGMLEPWALANRRLKKLVYSAFVERKNVARASCLHALTQAEANQYRHFGACGPIAVIPNAVTIPEGANSALFLDTFPLLRGKRLILFLGRLNRKKGLHLLLDAWTALGAYHNEAHLVLAGPDSDGLKTALETIIAERRLAESVSFPGMLGDEMKWSALASASAFVLPSHSEGLSVSVLEAMGMGLPVIVSRPCNMPEVATHDAGWQIEPALQPLIGALGEFLECTESQNRQRGARGAALIGSRYTWPVVAAQIAEVYNWLQGGKAPGTTEVLNGTEGLKS